MIGIIGATGDIGLECTKILNDYGIKSLRLGYRKKKKLFRVEMFLNLWMRRI